MNKNELADTVKQLARAIVESGNLNAILYAFVFLVSMIVIGAAVVVSPWALILLVFAGLFALGIPFITRAGRARGTKERVLRDLEGICRSTSRILTLDQKFVRSNIFRQCGDGQLRIVPGWHYNMDDRPAELTIAIPQKHGATGNAFQQRAAVIARAKGGWGEHTLSREEMDKLHPELQWIVSVPIPKPNGGGEVLGVVNVDGLCEDRTTDQLKPVQQELVWWSGQIAEEIQHGS